MNVLVVGGGGREHAMAAAIARSPRLKKLIVAPGNAGTAALGENVPINALDIPALLNLAKSRKIDLTVVGPEAPLCNGIVDAFEKAGLKVFGPSSRAARIEGDKAYAKEIMRRAVVPTAEARIFKHYEAAKTYVATRENPLVVKVAGLAAGKGVIMCDEPSEGLLALEQIMVHKEFGDAGNVVLVEERLQGPELSVFAIVDGQTILILDTARDYKKAYDNDEGPNTGGMGAVSPAPSVDDDILTTIQNEVLIPVVDALRQDDAPFKGVLYAGIMLTHAGPKVLEFNCRFGDPEAQVVLPRLQCDALELFLACSEGRLDSVDVGWDERPAVGVVLASQGYPGPYGKGRIIYGLEEAAALEDVQIFHSGTDMLDEHVVTAGGRVLNVVGRGDTIEQARARAYAGADLIRFDGKQFRRDIAAIT